MAVSWQRIVLSARNLTRWHKLTLWTLWQLTFSTFENPRWRTAAIFKNRQIAISPQWIDRPARSLARWQCHHSCYLPSSKYVYDILGLWYLFRYYCTWQIASTEHLSHLFILHFCINGCPYRRIPATVVKVIKARYNANNDNNNK